MNEGRAIVQGKYSQFVDSHAPSVDPPKVTLACVWWKYGYIPYTSAPWSKTVSKQDPSLKNMKWSVISFRYREYNNFLLIPLWGNQSPTNFASWPPFAYRKNYAQYLVSHILIAWSQLPDISRYGISGLQSRPLTGAVCPWSVLIQESYGQNGNNVNLIQM